MDPIVPGVVLLAVAAVLCYLIQINRQLERAAVGSGITTIDELNHLHQKVLAEVGSGLFAQRAGLEGVLECDNPLTSELSNTPCAAFRYRVERRWEEEYEERDEHGKRVRRVRSGSERVAGNERRVPFLLRDATGRIPIEPEGARLDLERVVDRFEPGNSGHLVRFGGFQIDIGGLAGAPKRRTIGYRFFEEILPLGRTVYVLGLATDRGGTLHVGRVPVESHEPFLVSLRSREQIVSTARKTVAYARYAAFACAPIGLILLIIGLLTRR
jgi:E3 Ubiquitin ligase